MVPGSADNVDLDRPSAPTVTYSNNQSYSISSLVVDQPLIVEGGGALGVATTTTLNNTIEFTTSGNFQGGTITAGAGGQILVPTGDEGNLLSVVVNAPINVRSGGILFFGGTNWQNNGLLTANSAQVAFGGSFNTTAIGSISGTGNFFYIAGTMTNTGATFSPASTNGSWTLGYSPTITAILIGGTVRHVHRKHRSQRRRQHWPRRCFVQFQFHHCWRHQLIYPEWPDVE